jgi:hypothetical protein
MAEWMYRSTFRSKSSPQYPPMFRRNISPPPSGSKNKPSNKTMWNQVAKHRLASNGLQDVIAQKTVFFITTAVRTSLTIKFHTHIKQKTITSHSMCVTHHSVAQVLRHWLLTAMFRVQFRIMSYKIRGGWHWSRFFTGFLRFHPSPQQTTHYQITGL